MSQYGDASPSPSRGLYEAPARRGGRDEQAPRRRRHGGDRGGDANGSGGCRGGRGGGSRSPSPRASARPRAFSPSPPTGAERSRSRSAPSRRGDDLPQEELPAPQAGPGRRRRHRAPEVRGRSASGGAARPRRRDVGSSSRHAAAARDRDRDRGKDKEKDRGRRGKDHRQKEYMKRLAAVQQNPAMRMAMMQGMMGMGMGNPAMHMAMMHQMGMMPPQYLHAMQAGMQPPGMPPFGPYGGMAPPKKRRGKDGAAASKRGGADASGASPGAAEGSASGSSSSDSSSEDSSDNDASAGVHPSMAPTAMAMWPGAAPGAGSSAGVEVFLSQCPVDPEAADRMRVLPPHLQQVVMARGPVSDTRNPSAVLIARVRDAELGRGGLEPPPGDLGMLGGGMMDGADDFGGKPARKSAKVTIEAMILEYRLSPGCAWMLRALPPDKQKMASRIDPSGQADPSGYVAEQMKKIV
mmetsp:Transcript_68934/g.224648  ORF Transcript_68934/g.224648 Transcript_68934/m.224648 type:complete len:465 (-) Transcript_68934:109-1503(-)